MSDLPDTTGGRIRYLRNHWFKETKKLSQEKLADRIGCKRGTVIDWESDTLLPSTDNLIKLSDLFNVSVDFLLCRIDETSHDVKFIHEYTGLSEEAINNLRFINSPPDGMKKESKLFNEKTLIMINTLLSKENYNVWLSSPFLNDNTPITVFTEMYDYTHLTDSEIKYLGSDDGSIPRYYNNRDLLKEMCIAQIRKILDRINDKKQPG